jgi:hypothetical protein
LQPLAELKFGERLRNSTARPKAATGFFGRHALRRSSSFALFWSRAGAVPASRTSAAAVRRPLIMRSRAARLSFAAVWSGG